MASIELSIGVGFGLFAIFSILRYRTDPMPSREMTYLFILIALPMINFILLSQNAYLELILTTALICLVLLFLEKGWGFHFMSSKSITYEKIDLINANNQKELIADLEERTGLMIHYVDINKINFLNDTAEIKVYYEEAKNER
jgi:Ca2+/Na+ antiporter